MSSRIYSDPIKLLNQAAADGVSTVIVDGCDYRAIFLTIIAEGTTTATVKVRTCDFATDTVTPTKNLTTDAASVTNPWTYAKLNDLSLASGGLDGATGVAFSGAAGVKRVEVNTNGQRKLAVEVTGYSGSGKVTVYAVTTNNQ